MQTTPSLVGTGSAIAAAASGFVFGLPTRHNLQTEHNTTATVPRRARRHNRTTSVDPAALTCSLPPREAFSFPSQRPATSSIAVRSAVPETYANTVHQTTRPPLSRRQRPQRPQSALSRSSGRPLSMVFGQTKPVPESSVAEENPRNSLTSSSSWLRRLSLRPLSQQGSPRSSLLADSPSITFSHGSAAPILASSGSVPKPLPPNKLVKRSSSRNPCSQESARTKSRGHLPSLRRPATSHQRSATLQQLRADIDVGGSSPDPRYSFDEPIRPEELLGASPIEDKDGSSHNHRATRGFTWLSFFHSRTETLAPSPKGNLRLGAGGDANSSPKGLSSRRIRLAERLTSRGAAHLIKPKMISHASTGSSPEDDARATYVADGDSDARGSPALAATDSNDVPRRSFSSSFAQDAAHRPSKTSGRLRRSNWSVGHDDNNSRRRVSAPAGGLRPSVDHTSGLTSPVAAPGYRPLTLNSAATEPRLAPTRISSSPLPPLSSHPTMTPDLFTQSVAVGGGTAQRLRRAQLSASPMSPVSAVLSPRRAPLHEASSTLGSLDGDEDDTDFKSDTIFDSLRTIDSGRARAVETPLESLYDESPTGTGNKKRSKRVSIQEILARSLEDDVDFMEESEFTTQPPVMPPTRQESQHDSSSGMNPSSPRQQSPITRDPHHLSLSDAFHEDWTGDEEDVPFSALSPPSKGNFLNPSRAHPNVRLALPRPTPSPQATQAPPSESLQTIHLRTELLALEGQDMDGELLVSRTGEAQQQPDLRGGRPVVRRGPTSTHARSQSVPVVQEGTEQSKPTGTKYGTWGTKMVSEDWEGDFEFGSRNDDQEGKSSRELFSVPESIQASQPRIKAHSVKIRELSLLVEDLKRLCQHGRESDLLNNERGPIWKEAEGIIALATIDYKNDVDDDDKSGTSIYLDAREAASSTADEERGELALRGLEAIAERKDRAVSRTAVIRERQSPRRRSVFSPEDDIFGVNRSSIEESTPKSSRPSRPRTPERASDQGLDNVVEAWSVKDILQLSTAAATPIIVDSHAEISRRCYNNRVPFDSNNLMDLVKRASELRDILSDIICRADRSTQSPVDTPRRERRLDSSPAFTRVFDDPGSSPPRRSALSRTDSVEEPSSLNSCMSANTIHDE